MTDLATIRIPVDSSDMVQAVRESKNLERGIKMLVDAFDSGAIGASQYSKGLSQLRQSFQHLFESHQQASGRVRKHARDLLESKEAAEQAAVAKNNLAMATKKAETAFALANQRAKEEIQTLRNRAETGYALAMQREREVSAQNAEFERLRQKYDQIYAASQIYERSLQEISQAHSLGILSIKQHEAAIESLNAEYQAFQNGTANVNNRFAQGVQQTASGLNNFGVITQQVGYQVGDFLVQVQSGTNAFVAFGQQATQLVGFLPMLAENLGIAASRLNVVAAFLSIAIPLTTAIAASFMRASDGAKEAEKAFESVADAMKGVSDASENLGKIAGESLRVAKEEARAFLEVIQEVRGATLQSALRNAIESTGFAKELESFETSLRPTQEAIMGGSARAADDMARSMEAFRSSVGLSYQESAKLQNLLRQIGGTTEQEIAQSFFKTVEDLKQMGLLTDEVKKLIAQMADEMGIVDQTFTDVNVSAEDALSKYSKMRTVAAQIANELARVAANTKAAADAALTAMSIEFSPAGQAMAKFAGRGTVSDRAITNQYGDEIVLFGSNRPRRRPNDIDADLPPEVKNKRGGGEQEDPLKKLREQLALENELLGVSEAQERVLRALGEKRGEYSEAEINAITAEVEAYNQKIEAITRTQKIMDTVKSSMEDAFMSMVDGTSSVKDAFKSMAAEIIKELYRVLVVQRMVSGISGGLGFLTGAVTGAPSTGTLGLPKLATGGSMMPNRPYLVGEHGPELVIPRHSGTVVNANQTAGAMSGGGAVTVQNNITVTGSDAAMVRAEVAKMIPQITNATKAAVIDAKQRGGQMAAAFR